MVGLRFVCELGFDGESFRVPARVKEGGFLVWEVGSSMSVARTVDAVLWENSDFFVSPNSAMKNS